MAVFFCAVVIQGLLAGAIYALIALAFVLVHKSSRMINFALGEWIMLGALFAGAGYYSLGLGAAGAILLAATCMALFGLSFNAAVVRQLRHAPVISLVTVTLGLGALMRGASALLLPGIPGGVELPIASDPLFLGQIPVSPEKLAAAFAAAAVVAAVSWFYGRSRTGIALRAIADDPQAAAATGIDLDAHFALLWGLTGAVSAFAGILWVLAAGGGFGLALVGLKIFPIVVIGGLDSLAGTILAAALIGLVESLCAAYLDPWLGAGFSTIAPYLLLIAMLMARPQGLFGHAPAVRV